MAVLVFAWVLILQLPPAGSERGTPSSDVPGEAALTFRTDASRSDLVAVGAEFLEDYGGFSVARGPASAMGSLMTRGHRAVEIRGASVIHFIDGPADVHQLPRSPVRAWARADNGRSVGVVHFHAPIKDSWRQDLEARGIDVLRYLPQNAFIIRGDSSAFEALWSLPYVDWVGPFDAAKKIRPEAAQTGAATVDVRIALFPGERPETLEAWLAHHDVPAGTRSGSSPAIVGAFGSGDFRWVRARIPADLLRAVADLPFVEFVDPVRIPRPLNAETDWVIQTNTSGNYRYWANGLDGRGQVVGIADTGVDYDGPSFRHSATAITTGDLYNVTDMSRRKVVRYVNMGVLAGQVTWIGGGGTWDPWSMMDSDHQPSGSDCTFGHGTAVGSTLTGNDNWNVLGGPNDGNALGAKLYVQDIGTIGPDPDPIEPPNCAGDMDLLDYLPEDLEDLFGPAGLVYNDPSAPVRIHSNSWGTSVNEYDLQARMVDAFVWDHPDLTVLFAAGNEGPASGTLDTPGTAKNVVTVGGAGNPDNGDPASGPNDVAFLSSRGPTADGRLKPTILAIFDGDSAMSDGDVRSGTGLADDHWQGTSYATPAAAAAAAIVRQYFADGWYPTGAAVASNRISPSAALVRAVLIASGVQLTGTDSRGIADVWPNNEQGFGRILLANVLPIAASGDSFRTLVVDDSSGLVTGDVPTYSFRVSSASRPLKFVLTWSDYPAALGAAKALVNDLDLEVMAPDGTKYRGNNFGTFSQGQSIPDGASDATNVEEAVILKAPQAGIWKVRVIGSDVAVGPQPFALVATGGLDPAYGRIALDRPVYSEWDLITIHVEDTDASSVQVRASSSVEAGGEVVTLSQGTGQGVWSGTIQTAFGLSAAADGILEVQDGDIVNVSYVDASPPHTDFATARVDAVGPVIFGVTADRPGTTSARIRWSTDEPATAGIWYGAAPLNLDGAAEMLGLRTRHALTLTGLAADTLYYYDVVSRDRLGHETRDSNAGRHYRFRTAPWGDVLLVLGDASFPEEREISYANALNARGWTWSAWRVADSGLPPLSLLQRHGAVIWQVGLEQYPAFNGSTQALVKTYLDRGGRLLVSSHDTAWSLDSVDSPWYNASAGAWVRGVLKASFACDPTTIGNVRGSAGDPISGANTSGITYAQHRDGGADDEVTVLQAGGTSATVWQDGSIGAGCPPAGGPVGLRWVSSLSNGTTGVGAWGGNSSRLVYFAFEITGLDATSTDLRPNSATRAAVLDNALQWLVSTATSSLDRDHPDVQLTAPNGGMFAGTTVTITWTASAYGATLANFSLLYSGDAGQTWNPIATVNGATVTYPWDVSAIPNGDRYLVRVVARDSGSPSFQGQDESDPAFTINRTGGDLVGPSIWAGSVRMSPNPPNVGGTVWFNATADDTLSGRSTILGAELFVAEVQPNSPTDDGLGLAMSATDGVFDGPLENVTWNGTLGAPFGASCIWVHAQDSAGNWGPYEVFCPDTRPPARAVVASIHLVNTQANVEIRWNRTLDDGLYGGTARYHVLRSNAPQAPFVNVSGDIPATRAANYTFVDVGAGLGNPSDYFYRIETVDDANNSAMSEVLAAKFHIAVTPGMNLLGMPVDAADRSLSGLAGGVPWSDAWAYDGCAGGFGWTSAVPAEASSFLLGPGRGFWLNATTAGTFDALGLVPATARIPLCTGWNLVALPGFAAGMTVAMVKASTGADAIVGFDPADAYYTRPLGDSEILAPGQGLWIRVPADVTWSVAGW